MVVVRAVLSVDEELASQLACTHSGDVCIALVGTEAVEVRDEGSLCVIDGMDALSEGDFGVAVEGIHRGELRRYVDGIEHHAGNVFGAGDDVGIVMVCEDGVDCVEGGVAYALLDGWEHHHGRVARGAAIVASGDIESYGCGLRAEQPLGWTGGEVKFVGLPFLEGCNDGTVQGEHASVACGGDPDAVATGAHGGGDEDIVQAPCLDGHGLVVDVVSVCIALWHLGFGASLEQGEGLAVGDYLHSAEGVGAGGPHLVRLSGLEGDAEGLADGIATT